MDNTQFCIAFSKKTGTKKQIDKEKSSIQIVQSHRKNQKPTNPFATFPKDYNEHFVHKMQYVEYVMEFVAHAIGLVAQPSSVRWLKSVGICNQKDISTLCGVVCHEET